MPRFLEYELRVALCLLCLWLFFFVFLRRSCLYRINRLVLLGSCLLSLVLPALPITVVRRVVQMPEDVLYDGASSASVFSPLAFFSWFVLVGMAVVFLLQVSGWLSVLLFLKKSRTETVSDRQKAIFVSDSVRPFSFFRTIVLSRKDYCQNSIVYVHESAHVALGHSWDVLFVDLLIVLQWFNPVIWMIRRDLRAVHEYEADAYVLASGVDSDAYVRALLAAEIRQIRRPDVQQFAGGTIMDRVKMISRRNGSSSYVRLFVMVPAVFLSVLLSLRVDNEFVPGYSVLDAVCIRRIVPGSPGATPDIRIIDSVTPDTPYEGHVPEFLSSGKGFPHWMAERLQYPKTDDVGVVLARFQINASGQMDHISILKGASAPLDDAVIAALNQGALWEPFGTSEGLELVLPVVFSH